VVVARALFALAHAYLTRSPLALGDVLWAAAATAAAALGAASLARRSVAAEVRAERARIRAFVLRELTVSSAGAAGAGAGAGAGVGAAGGGGFDALPGFAEDEEYAHVDADVGAGAAAPAAAGAAASTDAASPDTAAAAVGAGAPADSGDTADTAAPPAATEDGIGGLVGPDPTRHWVLIDREHCGPVAVNLSPDEAFRTVTNKNFNLTWRNGGRPVPAPMGLSQTQIDRLCFDMPPRFVAAEMGDVAKGKVRWIETKKWRVENRINDILIRPYPLFPRVRQLCGHVFHGHSKTGDFIYIERPGRINMKALRALGVQDDELQRHYLHNVEYQWAVLDNRLEGKCFSILDLEGIGMRDIVGGSAMGFVKGVSKLLQAHYPVRSTKIILVNVPSWFNMIWKVVKPLLHERTVKKTVICNGAEIGRQLLELVDADQLPAQYGGTCRCPGPLGCFGDHKLEKDYHEFVAKVNTSNL
jgi:hypothetical protein